MVRWLILLGILAIAACATQPRASPRQAAYSELRKNMGKMEVARILRGNRHVRLIQMGDPSDPSDDLEFWYYTPDPSNDYVVFSSEGKLLQWEYHEPLQVAK